MMKKIINQKLWLVAAGIAVAMAVLPKEGELLAAIEKKPALNTKIWLETSLHRVFPNSPPGTRTELPLLAARNQKLSFQACVRNKGIDRLNVKCSISGAPDLQVRVRRVGYVPMPHHTNDVPSEEQDGLEYLPGLVPDPLFPEQTTLVGPEENQSFWISVTVPANTQPGLKTLKVLLTTKYGKKKERITLGEMTAKVDVQPLTIQPRKNFPVTHWWQAEAIFDYYKAGRLSGERQWQVLEPYLKNMVEHGSNVVWVPVFHARREIVPRPSQLLKVEEVSPGRYEFDFSDVRRFVKMAKKAGFEYFEFPHFWLYWGVRNPIHVYFYDRDKWSLFWPTDVPATTGVFRTFLEQYLPELHQFLKEEQILDRSYFHVSDEPGGDEHVTNYKKARTLLRELAPWMKVMDALSDIRYGKEGLTDIPVPLLPAAEAYRKEGIPHWVYFCTGPRGKYLNRFFDTPLAKIRMAGWLFYRLEAKGFLHWGYNYWYQMETQDLLNVYQEGAGGDWPYIPYGDPFVVYPGPAGPIDSIRWEVFAESLQDYALLQTAGISPNDPLLAQIKTYADFPKTEEWIQRAQEAILKK